MLIVVDDAYLLQGRIVFPFRDDRIVVKVLVRRLVLHLVLHQALVDAACDLLDLRLNIQIVAWLDVLALRILLVEALYQLHF